MAGTSSRRRNPLRVTQVMRGNREVNMDAMDGAVSGTSQVQSSKTSDSAASRSR